MPRQLPLPRIALIPLCLLFWSAVNFAESPKPADESGVQELMEARAQQALKLEQMNALNPVNAQLSPDEIANALKKIREEGLPVELFPEKTRPILQLMNQSGVRQRWVPWMELLQSPAWLKNMALIQKHENLTLVSSLMLALFVITFFVKRKSLANSQSFGGRLYVRLTVAAIRWGGMIVIASMLLGAPFNQTLKLLGPVIKTTFFP